LKLIIDFYSNESTNKRDHNEHKNLYSIIFDELVLYQDDFLIIYDDLPCLVKNSIDDKLSLICLIFELIPFEKLADNHFFSNALNFFNKYAKSTSRSFEVGLNSFKILVESLC
jgi:hypothetical protein